MSITRFLWAIQPVAVLYLLTYMMANMDEQAWYFFPTGLTAFFVMAVSVLTAISKNTPRGGL